MMVASTIDGLGISLHDAAAALSVVGVMTEEEDTSLGDDIWELQSSTDDAADVDDLDMTSKLPVEEEV